MSKKLFFLYDKEIQKKDEEKRQYHKQRFSKHSRNTILENEYDQDFKGIKQTNLIYREGKNNIEPKNSEKPLNDNAYNALLNKFENLENQINDVKSELNGAKTGIVDEIKALGNIIQISFENFSKLIIEIIQGRIQVK